MEVIDNVIKAAGLYMRSGSLGMPTASDSRRAMLKLKHSR